MLTLIKAAQLISLPAVLATGWAAAAQPVSALDEGLDLKQEVTPASAGIDLGGTWAGRVTSGAKITAPLIGASDGPIDLAVKFLVKREHGQLTADVQICALTTDSANLKVDYAKVLPYMKVTVSEPDFDARIGGKIPLPTMNFKVGTNEAGASLDVDSDDKPGGTLPIVALGLLAINTYAGLDFSVSIDATLAATDQISGTSSFLGKGKIFGSNSPLLTAGEFTLEQTVNPTVFNAKRIATGDLTCAEVLTKI